MQVKFEQLENAAVLTLDNPPVNAIGHALREGLFEAIVAADRICLLYTSPSPRDATLSRMPSSA